MEPEKKYLKEAEVKAIYGIGYRAIQRLVRERQLRRKLVANAWRYPVTDLEKIFSPRSVRFRD